MDNLSISPVREQQILATSIPVCMNWDVGNTIIAFIQVYNCIYWILYALHFYGYDYEWWGWCLCCSTKWRATPTFLGFNSNCFYMAAHATLIIIQHNRNEYMQYNTFTFMLFQSLLLTWNCYVKRVYRRQMFNTEVFYPQRPGLQGSRQWV